MHKVGGQAIIEGVMMRSANKMAIAVRNPKGKIVIKIKKLNLLSERMKKWIFFRGIVNLVEMLSHGFKALNYSADIAMGEDKKKEKTNRFFFVIMLLFSVGLGLLIFKFLPLLAAQLINPSSNIVFNIIDGGIKLFIFIAYVYAISLMKDVKRVFQYHGAEHKVINCYETKEKLTVENAKKYSTLNPRCGTSFIMIVILVSILTYVFIPKTVPFLYKLLYRILLLPVIAGISYEILKLSARYEKNFFFRLFVKPGVWIQRITTREPDDKQLEVALVALKKVL
ncbi:MAG: DUF1385 domain-containing protein [Nanoarchaeota archaeon]|nr:DUF1385 domain-containing protein [Nanoarchaeota archaeon]